MDSSSGQRAPPPLGPSQCCLSLEAQLHTLCERLCSSCLWSTLTSRLSSRLNVVSGCWIVLISFIEERTNFKQTIQRVLKNTNIHVTHHHNHDRDNSLTPGSSLVPLWSQVPRPICTSPDPTPGNQESVFHHNGSVPSGFHVQSTLFCLASVPLHNTLHTDPHCSVPAVHSFMLLSSLHCMHESQFGDIWVVFSFELLWIKRL